MPVAPQLINLLNLSVPTLQRLAKEAGVEVASRWQKWDYVSALSDLSRADLDQLAGEWLYAGQTSVTWVALGERDPVDIEAVRAALVAMYDRDPLEIEDIRPETVTNRPQLVSARVWRDSKVVFTFVVAKPVARVIHNFESDTVYIDEFFVAVLRLDQGMLEIRASHARAKLLANTWLAEFAQHLEEDTVAA
jgi:hypothetical protein